MPDDRTSATREDKGAETSINWEDDSTVLFFTLNNEQLATFGAARNSYTERIAGAHAHARAFGKNPRLW